MTSLLVVAKAPVPGLVKTRLVPGLTRALGCAAAGGGGGARAAAALLDTLAACADACVSAQRRGRDRLDGPGRTVVALDGDLAAASRSAELRHALRECHVVPQRGAGLAARLAAAHADAAAATGDPAVVQIGMDTPQVSAELLLGCAAALRTARAGLGPAPDGGWWVLAVQDAVTAVALREVAMSTSGTAAATVEALRAAGAPPLALPSLRDVDTLEDALAVAADAPGTRFAAALALTVGVAA